MIIINNSSMIPIYEQIVNQVKQNIVDGKLKEGDVLPSVRGLSKDLKISALTVKKAYDILETKKVIKNISTKGTFISDSTKEVIENKKQEIILEIKEKVDMLIALGMNKEDIIKKLK